MATTKQTRIRLSELATVEIGTAKLDALADPEPASSAASALEDSPELNALPSGVSPAVALLLDLPERQEEADAPGAGGVGAAPETAPARTAQSGPQLGLLLAGVLLTAGIVIAGWFATRPPALDARAFWPTTVEPPPASSSEREVGFVALPEPAIAAEPEPSDAARPERPRRRAPSAAPVRGRDLL